MSHDINKFKVGDTVKIIRKVESDSDGWANSWVRDMDNYIGTEFVIGWVSECGYENASDGYAYSSESLELVKSNSPEVFYHSDKYLRELFISICQGNVSFQDFKEEFK